MRMKKQKRAVNPEDRKSVLLNIRMTPLERDKLRELASSKGLSLSAFVRSFIIEKDKRRRL